jgi:MFS family permease
LVHYIRSLLARHSFTLWLLTIGRFIDMSTLWMALPYMSLFVKRAGGSYGAIGLVLSLNPVAQLIGNLIGGQWSDRKGRRPVILASMGLRAAVLLGFALATQIWQFALLSFGNGLVNALFNPAYTSAIADITPMEKRAEAFGLSRVMTNLGVGIGPLLGSLFGVEAQRLIFGLASASSALVACLYLLKLPETIQQMGRPGSFRLREMLANWRLIFTDRALLLFVGGSMLSNMNYGLLHATLALYLSTWMPNYERVYGLVWTLNGLLVVLLQLPVTALMLRTSMRIASAVGCITFGLGYLLFALARAPFHFHVATFVWTLGEVMLAVPNTTFVTDVAPTPLRARYVGASGLDRAVGGMIAPLVGTAILQAAGGQAVLYFACGSILVAAVLLGLAEVERERRLAMADTAA